MSKLLAQILNIYESIRNVLISSNIKSQEAVRSSNFITI